MPICNLCGMNKGDDDFYRSVKTRCKDCHKSCVRENRADNIEYYRAYDRKRDMLANRAKYSLAPGRRATVDAYSNAISDLVCLRDIQNATVELLLERDWGQKRVIWAKDRNNGR